MRFIFIIAGLAFVIIRFCSLGLLQAQTSPAKATIPAVTSSPQKIEELRKRAELARDSGQPADALRLYKQLVALQPKWAEGWWYVGSINYHLKQFTPAALAYEQFVNCEPDNGKGWGMLGVCEAQLKKTPQALPHLEKAIATNLGGDPAIIRLVRFHYALMLNRIKEFQYAFFFLHALALEHQSSDEVLDAMGMSILHKADWLETLSEPDRVMVREFGRAAYLTAEGKLAEADPVFQQLEIKYHGKPGVAFACGLNLHLQQKFDQAEPYFRQEYARNPLDVEVLIELAICSLSSGAVEEGFRFASKAVELAPDNGMAFYYLGRFQMRRSDWTQALKSLEKAAQLAPQAYEIQYALSQVYAKLNRLQEANRAKDQYEHLQAIFQKRIGMVPFEGK